MSDSFTLQLRCQRVFEDPNFATPDARSAHNCVLGPGGILYLLAGDAGTAQHRFDDTWRLHSQECRFFWEQVRQHTSEPAVKQDNKYVPYTARSNAAAATAGDWLLIFGGWCKTGLEPLSHLEAFCFRTSTWHLVAAQGRAPSPRGQPAAAANTAGTEVYLFGGWDGHHRYNDLHRLLVCGQGPQDWIWQHVVPQPAPPKGAIAGVTFQEQQARHTQQQGNLKAQVMQQSIDQLHQVQELPSPCQRADHAMVCWHYCDDGLWKDLLVVFGGSCDQGLLNDTWLFDINTQSWSQAFYGGAAPCPRSSCAAALSGDILLLHGGQTPAGVLHDMHLLNLSTLTWLQVDLGDSLYPLCRHSMVINDSSCLIFGGYTGSSTSRCLLSIDLQPVHQLQRSCLQDLIRSMACYGFSVTEDGGALQEKGGTALPSPAAVAECSVAEGTLKAVGVVHSKTPVLAVPPIMKALSKKAAVPPLQLSDLPNAEEAVQMPQWKQVRHLHQAALAAGCDQYVDPKTGYTVFTAKYLQQRQCCGNKCRHCPHGWVNVAQRHAQQQGSRVLQSADSCPDW